jgi:ABC transport system ATP-binding/permease protein
MPLLLSCQSLAKSFQRPLFDGITLGIYDGERIGLIGPNGSGKSTFLKILADLEHADAGEVTRRRDMRVAYVPQQDAFPENSTPFTVLDQTLASDDHAHLDEHDRHTQASIMLTKIGFPDFDQPVASLSGGWKKRLAIARALVVEPDLLLMDEPTNHLDLEGIYWLEKLLASSRFATLVVSHDRYFLENMTTRIIEINRTYPDGFFSVTGTYSDFLLRREDFLEAQAIQQQTLANTVRREAEWLKKGPKARTTKAKYRIDAAHKMMDDLSDLKSRNASTNVSAQIEFSATERKTNKLLAAHNLTKSLGGRMLFSGLDFVLSPGTKLGLVGPNGSGKTTLLRLMTGDLEPDAGTIKRATALRIVFFDQARQQLDRTMTLKEALSPHSRGIDQVIYQDQPMHITSWAKRFLFRTEQLNLPVSMLSGGEQARVLIARLMLHPADLLILDEPTNDLDIPSLEVLEESLEEFPGALVLVTHDRFMLERLSTELLGLDGRGNANLYTDLEQWRRAVAAAAEAETSERKAESAAKAAEAKPQKKKYSYAEQKELETIEQRVLAAEAQVEANQKALDAHITDPKKLEQVCHDLHTAQELVQALYARWQELESKRS